MRRILPPHRRHRRRPHLRRPVRHRGRPHRASGCRPASSAPTPDGRRSSVDAASGERTAPNLSAAYGSPLSRMSVSASTLSSPYWSIGFTRCLRGDRAPGDGAGCAIRTPLRWRPARSTVASPGYPGRCPGDGPGWQCRAGRNAGRVRGTARPGSTGHYRRATELRLN